MLKRDTTFIIGAGASYNIGFPLGDNLRDQIIDLLRVDDTHNRVNFRDETIGRIVQDRAGREGGTGDWPTRAAAYRRAAATIRDGLPFARSIDSFLDGLRGQPEIEFLGKLAIATAILRAESSSPLAFQKVEAGNAAEIHENYLRAVLASWHSELGQILYDGHTVETIERPTSGALARPCCDRRGGGGPIFSIEKSSSSRMRARYHVVGSSGAMSRSKSWRSRFWSNETSRNQRFAYIISSRSVSQVARPSLT